MTKEDIDWGDYNNFKDFLNDCDNYCTDKMELITINSYTEKDEQDNRDIKRLKHNIENALNVYDVKNTEEFIKLTTENYRAVEQFYKEEYEDIEIEDEMHDLFNEYVYIMNRLHCLKKREQLRIK